MKRTEFEQEMERQCAEYEKNLAERNAEQEKVLQEKTMLQMKLQKEILKHIGDDNEIAEEFLGVQEEFSKLLEELESEDQEDV